MKRAWAVIEVFGTLLGFFWLFAPPAWQEVNRGVTIALLVVLALCALASLGLIIHLIIDQRKPPYLEESYVTASKD